MRRTRIILAFVAAVFASTFISASNVSAQTVNDLKEKFVRQGFYTCYTGSSYMHSDVKAGAFTSSVSGAADGISMRDTLFKTNDTVVGLPPNYLGDADEYSCADFLANVSGTGAQVIDSKNKTAAEAAAKLTDLGYKESGASETACTTFTFANANTTNAGDLNEQTSLTLCAKVDKTDRKIQENVYLADRTVPSNGSNLKFETTSSTVKLNGYGPGSEAISVKYSVGNKFDNIMDALDLNLQKYKRGENSEGNMIGTTGGGMYVYYSRTGIITNSDEGKQYAKESTSYIDAYKNLRPATSYGYNTFSKEEQAALYQDYLVSFYGVKTANCSSGGNPSSNGLVVGDSNNVLGYHKSKIYGSDGKVKTCYIEASEAAANKKVFGVTGSGASSVPSMVKKSGRIGLLDIIKWMNANAPDKISAELAGSIGEAAPGDTTGEEEDPTDSGTDSCWDGGGALGWVLCPVLEFVGDATNKIYEEYIEPALTISASLFSEGGDEGGIYNSWQIFQTFANIVFAIMILVVIISQVTGFGIDNYGIKRILPRLIVSALLINLSFIICQLAVDISNILGVSLKNLFSSIGPSVGGTGQAASATGHLVSTAVVIIFALSTAGIILSQGAGIIIIILLGALSGLIAVFFLFLTLSVRQAAVVILTVISPIAFVLYMLPNTKKYFDRLVKIFASLLLIFPICGLIIGGGDFASRVILQAGGVAANETSDAAGLFYQLSAMLIGIVPIFFIPSIVRGSMSALGNIGAKINGFGRGVSGRATGAARGALQNTRLGDPSRFSRWSQVRRTERRDAAERESNLRRAQSRVKRLNARRERLQADGRTLSDADARRLATAQSSVEKYANEDFDARFSLAKNQYKDYTDDEVIEEWSKAFDNGDTAELGALTKLAHSRMGSNATKRMADEMAEKKGYDRNPNYQASLGALRQQFENDGKLAGDFRSKAYDAHAMIASGGITGREGEDNHPVYASDMGHFSSTGKLDTIQDFATQSTGALRRAAESGKLSPAMASMIMKSDDPNIKSGIMSDEEKAEIIRNTAGAAPTGQSSSGSNNSNGNSNNSSSSTGSGTGPSSTTSADGSELTIEHGNNNRNSSTGPSNNVDTFGGDSDMNDYYNGGGNL